MTLTANQFALLFSVLVLGWLLGLLTSSGGRERRRAIETERDQLHRQIEAANLRIAELERNQPAITGGTGAAVAAAARGDLDDLTRIDGIGRDEEVRLNEAGVQSFRQVAALSPNRAAELEGRLGKAPGTIDRQEWRAQAAELAR